MELSLIVDVTAEDIVQGDGGSCRRCPIALSAARSAAPLNPTEIWIGSIWATLYYGGRTLNCRLPSTARDFIDAFDEDRPVNPVRFALTFTEDR